MFHVANIFVEIVHDFIHFEGYQIVHTFGLSKMAAAIGSSCKLFAYTGVSYADALVFIANGVLRTLGRMCATVITYRLISLGIGSISSQEELSWDSSSSVHSSVVAVASYLVFPLLDTTTVLSSAMFSSSKIAK